MLRIHRTDRARLAGIAFAAVRLALAVEVMAAGSAGPAFSFGQAGNVHGVADTKNVGADWAADAEFFRNFFHAEFANDLRHHLGGLNMAGDALTELFGGTRADLHGGIAVFFGCLMMNNGMVAD